MTADACVSVSMAERSGAVA